jgi:hypothetical protein
MGKERKRIIYKRMAENYKPTPEDQDSEPETEEVENN